MPNLDDLLNRVSDESSFVALRVRWQQTSSILGEKENESQFPYGPAVNGWENTSIESFLHGAATWGEASNLGVTQGLSPANPWQRFATYIAAKYTSRFE